MFDAAKITLHVKFQQNTTTGRQSLLKYILVCTLQLQEVEHWFFFGHF